MTAAPPPDGSFAGAHAEVIQRLERGASLPDAVTNADADRGGEADLALGVVGAAARTGGRSGEALDRAAAALRKRAAAALDRETQSAQARLSARVLTALPLLTLTLLFAVDSDVRSVVATPVGAALVVAGLALCTISWLWMRATIRRAADGGC